MAFIDREIVNVFIYFSKMSFFLRKQAEKSQKVSTKERFYTKKADTFPITRMYPLK